MEPEIMMTRAREASPIEMATRHLSERIDLLHKRLEELGALLQPYCRPEELRPDDNNVSVVRDRDASSSHREELDLLAVRVQAANERVDNFIAHCEL